ncbi:paired amphipathic helix protein Sin3-like 1 [Syzygium oleosum]|uniref:paired amphipathic helix protein Sin3-like 1 n=1 Tax=Syzygium oleosum TaxID=219896 RepID=UPI0024BACBB9|nr:paired amphipathic helix protein Sin3-like 1 [Syzygium oleosum]
MFQQIMIDFKSQRIDRARVVAIAKELFKGHNRLIHGFNTFLPVGCEIALDEAPVSKKPASLEDAIDFIHKLKECFRIEEHIYISFHNILHMYQHGKEIDAIYNEVACLFAGHPDLIEAFKRFLPENFRHEEELSCITTRTSCRVQMVDSQSEDEVTQRLR